MQLLSCARKCLNLRLAYDARREYSATSDQWSLGWHSPPLVSEDWHLCIPREHLVHPGDVRKESPSHEGFRVVQDQHFNAWCHKIPSF